MYIQTLSHFYLYTLTLNSSSIYRLSESRISRLSCIRRLSLISICRFPCIYRLSLISICRLSLSSGAQYEDSHRYISRLSLISICTLACVCRLSLSLFVDSHSHREHYMRTLIGIYLGSHAYVDSLSSLYVDSHVYTDSVSSLLSCRLSLSSRAPYMDSHR